MEDLVTRICFYLWKINGIFVGDTAFQNLIYVLMSMQSSMKAALVSTENAHFLFGHLKLITSACSRRN